MIDWFEWHVKLSRVILCLQIRELHSLYVHIHTFASKFQKGSRIIKKPIYLIHKSIDGTLTVIISLGQIEPGGNANESVLHTRSLEL